ncbi:hypothetical protein DICVIV_10543 [Dictyocaulus viviparus]|uniref:Uncharacterized protein n=1 Tax=Dictyocaulus viviparus TaxID=29172 RepID=A0A0D8XFS5_DICVI|nr:hypothetical protein DICVIV_10543 [Dictyocaulus viviparus]
MELLGKAVDLRDSQILNLGSYNKMIWRRRFMAAATVIAWGPVDDGIHVASISRNKNHIAVVVLIAALATPDWAVLDFMNTEYQHVHVQLGVWGEWRTIKNATHKTGIRMDPTLSHATRERRPTS